LIEVRGSGIPCSESMGFGVLTLLISLFCNAAQQHLYSWSR